jgi:DNA polymerase-3 subunit delta'
MQHMWPIVGHQWAVDLLAHSIEQGRLAHAYLFVGPPRIGKSTLAQVFAQTIQCTGQEKPCGVCRSCQLALADRHPDVLTIAPDNGRIKIESIRELQHVVSLSPVEGPYRVCVISQVDLATLSAANSLLKTLEEPPARVILVLTADRGDLLLPTLVSRCQVLTMRPLSTEHIVAALSARGVESDRARLVGHLARGRMGWALDAVQDDRLLQQREQVLSSVVTLGEATYRDRFSWAEQLSKSPDQILEVLETLASWWRDILIVASGSRAPLANVDRHAQLGEWAGRYGIGTAKEMLRCIRDMAWRLERNANVRLALEVLALDLPGLYG